MKAQDLERLALLIAGVYVVDKVFSGAAFFKKAVVEPVQKFVGPSRVPPGPAQAKLLQEIDKFKATGYLDDEIKAARATVANDAANVEQKLTAILTLQKKIDTAKGYGFGDRVADVEAALHEYATKEVGPEAARVRLQG